jgi:hypothetical protein
MRIEQALGASDGGVDGREFGRHRIAVAVVLRLATLRLTIDTRRLTCFGRRE